MTEIIRLAASQSPDPSIEDLRGGSVSIGNFDGVHRGHAALLRRVRTLADQSGTAAVAVTFDPHPAVILGGRRPPPRLTGLDRRAELMGQLGIDALLVCETTRDLLSLSAEAFYDWLVGETLDAGGLVEGPNFFFGKDRGGNVDLLARWCERDQRRFEIAAPTRIGERLVSSSRIRDRLIAGDVRDAADLLGHPHRLTGDVVPGDGRGRTIGFPTANLAIDDLVVPAHGVYAGLAGAASVPGRHLAAIHIGPNPTFDAGSDTKVEIHVLDFAGDLYGRPLSVDLIDRVRDIARFESAEALIEQLHRDVADVRRRLQTKAT